MRIHILHLLLMGAGFVIGMPIGKKDEVPRGPRGGRLRSPNSIEFHRWAATIANGSTSLTHAQIANQFGLPRDYVSKQLKHTYDITT